MFGMRKFQDTFETLKRSFISVFSICMTVPLKANIHKYTNSYLNNFMLCFKILSK